MSQFEYINTFTSFLFAIMAGRVLVTFSELVIRKISWYHVGWLCVLTLNMLQTWWLRWSGNEQTYSYIDYLVFTSIAFTLAFSVAVLTPTDSPDDWSEFFQTRRIKFFASYAVFWLTLVGSNYYFEGQWQGAVSAMILCILGALISNRHFQSLLVIFFLGMFSFRIYLLGAAT